MSILLIYRTQNTKHVDRERNTLRNIVKAYLEAVGFSNQNCNVRVLS